MVNENSDRRRTRSQSKQSMVLNIDINNNENDDNLEIRSMELEDGTRLRIGDIVGLQQNHLNTPFVVENFKG